MAPESPLIAPGAEVREVHALLLPFLQPGVDVTALTAALRPDPDHHARVFDASIADKMREMYDEVWEMEPRITHKPHQTGLLVAACPSEAFVAGNPLMAAFPAGYAGAAPLLVPGRIWACWKFVAPGERLGMAYDGLVKLDRWVWFPRAWGFVRRAQAAGE